MNGETDSCHGKTTLDPYKKDAVIRFGVIRIGHDLIILDPENATDEGRSELATIGLDGSGLRDLTASEAGVQWSGPRWSPGGDSIVASRWRPGGWLDVVLVDPASGAVTPLTDDRAKDVEPTWSPQGDSVVFRSDRDGVSNLYAFRLADRALLRVTNVLGGAFTPDVSPTGTGSPSRSTAPAGTTCG